MLKFVKQNMETIDGIGIYPVISFIIFFSFFVLMLIYILRSDKKRMNQLSSMPLDLDNLNTTNDHEEQK